MYVNADGNVLPCCIGDYLQPLGNTHNRNIKDIWNSHEYKTLRKQLMNGEKPSICHQCWKHEEAGNNSSRISNNKRFKEEMQLYNFLTKLSQSNKISSELNYNKIQLDNFNEFNSVIV